MDSEYIRYGPMYGKCLYGNARERSGWRIRPKGPFTHRPFRDRQRSWRNNETDAKRIRATTDSPGRRALLMKLDLRHLPLEEGEENIGDFVYHFPPFSILNL